MKNQNWAEYEVEIIVNDYFSMLKSELKGINYKKAEHRRTIINKLNNRSDSSIEKKHMNISAALITMGLPYIPGYKPYKNYQKIIVDSIQDYLESNSVVIELIKEDVNKKIKMPKVENILNTMVEPPIANTYEDQNKKTSYFKAKKVNYIEIESKNRSLGNKGELFILEYERARLAELGKSFLADKVEHTSKVQGDGTGFDIHSYESDGTDRFIEVKTTKYGKETPFFISPNEINFSKQNIDKYFLYRVYNFRINPLFFPLVGNVEKHCNLTPTNYIARF